MNNFKLHVSWVTLGSIAMLLFASGCATLPQRSIPNLADAHAPTPEMFESQFERGWPNKVVDGIGWVVGIPSKLVLLDKRAANHNVSETTEAELASYLQTNSTM